MGNTTNKMSDNKYPGMLSLIMGPMYAGKTTALIQLYEKFICEDKNVIVITHSSEIRYSIDQLSSHDKKKINCLKYSSIKDFILKETDKLADSSVILIDESQFFDDLQEVLYIVNTLYKHVYVFGLDGDFKRNKFGKILDLVPHCDEVKKIKAKCNLCNSDAIFSHRTTNSSKQLLVGACDDYQSLCRLCYNRVHDNKL